MTNFPRPWTYRLNSGKHNQWEVTDANGDVVERLTTYRFDPIVEQIVAAVNVAPADVNRDEVAVSKKDLGFLASALAAMTGGRRVDVLDEDLAADFMRTAKRFSEHAIYLDRIARR